LFFSSCLRTPGLASACRRLYLTCRPCDLQLPIENSSASPKAFEICHREAPSCCDRPRSKPNVLLLGREISCWTSNARAKCWREATDAIEMEVRRSGCA
jgi:hypothetical protein